MAERRLQVGMLASLNDLLLPANVGPKPPRAGPVDHEPPPGQAAADAEGVGYKEIIFEQPIGAGSFGAVWRGSCRGDVVAIKACRVGDAKEGAMLLREIRYLQKLRHPRLVSFLGFCNRPPHIYLLMEFMSGGSLHALLFGPSAKRTRLPFAKKSRMSLQVAEGLAYLHLLSVVHRDLKTMNIVLDAEHNCKICDFGLTVTLEKTHLTVRHVQGSPRYMAPEQFESTAKITEKVDIWQMGCVMLELFCSCVPFKGATGMQQIATDLLVKRRAPGCPAEADPRARVLVQSCLRIDARHRPWADTLVEALACVLAGCEDADHTQHA
ncbi:unnamed protein product [Prorocentrum cordatum]|uniref:Protein kinase domain-containing protein n=1 Tax=Prorocentrum cordatum TaxID=2364126 RepID=A0ABN9WVM9_9DINO|nr:unnamed protein product [Polarella glacialis]